MARSTNFRISESIIKNNFVIARGNFTDRPSKPYLSNGRGGLNFEEEHYISNLLEFIRGYYEVVNYFKDSTSDYNKISLPLIILRFKNQLKQEIFQHNNNQIRHTTSKDIIMDSFEYQWLITERYHIYSLFDNGEIDLDKTELLIKILKDNIKRNGAVLKNDIYKDSVFAERYKIDTELLKIITK